MSESEARSGGTLSSYLLGVCGCVVESINIADISAGEWCRSDAVCVPVKNA